MTPAVSLLLCEFLVQFEWLGYREGIVLLVLV
jgi:hypothetical protein